MSLTSLPSELYVRILHRLDSTDDALRGYDFPLRDLYSKYDNELRDYLSKDTSPEDTLQELQKAIGRPRGYRGIAINAQSPRYEAKLADKFDNFYTKTPARFATALTQLLDDPALNLKFENGRLTLSVADLSERGDRPIHYATIEFEQTEDKIKIGATIQLKDYRRNTLTIDGAFPFTTKQQAIAVVKQALTDNKTQVLQCRGALGGLLLGSSLFLRKIKIFIRVDWDASLFSKTQANTFTQNFDALRKMSEIDPVGARFVWHAFRIDPDSVLAAAPFCINLARLPGVKTRTEVSYCEYRLR